LNTVISKGFSDEEREQVAHLYWQAFGPKLGKVMNPPDRARTFLANALNPDFALAARNRGGSLLELPVSKLTRAHLLVGHCLIWQRHMGGRVRSGAVPY
jgi:hypothetical protein